MIDFRFCSIANRTELLYGGLRANNKKTAAFLYVATTKLNLIQDVIPLARGFPAAIKYYMVEIY